MWHSKLCVGFCLVSFKPRESNCAVEYCESCDLADVNVKVDYSCVSASRPNASRFREQFFSAGNSSRRRPLGFDSILSSTSLSGEATPKEAGADSLSGVFNESVLKPCFTHWLTSPPAAENSGQWWSETFLQTSGSRRPEAAGLPSLWTGRNTLETIHNALATA